MLRPLEGTKVKYRYLITIPLAVLWMTVDMFVLGWFMDKVDTVDRPFPYILASVPLAAVILAAGVCGAIAISQIGEKS
jgi:hypothetical protein